ncbi:MAG: hypothetical protein A2Z29_01805 [Chloroflexi bacterium RBG_16_56_11]|nr:MAG: hypothetical protein A2Z29_01805 [Chloroflexi bacterium RBG_16_56_11]
MNAYLVLPLVQAFSCLVLTVTVLLARFRSFTYRLFSVFLASLTLWGFLIYGMRASPDTAHAYLWEKWLIPLAVFMAAVYYHFSVVSTTVNRRKWIVLGLYIIVLASIPLTLRDYLIAGVLVKPYGYAPKYAPVGMVLIALVLILGAFAAGNWYRVFRTSPRPDERNRAAYILTGCGIIAIGGLFDVLPLMGLPAYPGLVISIIIFCLLTTVAILKYNLLDIRFVLRKSFAYILTSAAMAVPVIGLFFFATFLLAESPVAPWVYFVLIIILAFSVPALWGRIQKQVDKWFYRDRYSSLEALETYNWHAQSLGDISMVVGTTVKLVAGALRASDVYLMQPVPASGDFQVVATASGTGDTSGVVIKAQNPLLRWLQHSGGPLRFRDIVTIPQLQNVVWEETEPLQRIGVELIAPLRLRGGQVSGLILVGKKLAGQSYSVEDIQIVTTISNQIAVTLENTRLYRDILESRENLETWLNNMTDCVMIVGKNQTIQFMNNSASASFGSRAERKCWQALEREEICPDCPVPGGGENNQASPRPIGSRNIGAREYEVATAPLLNPDGSLSLIEVFRDVTERKRLEEEIIRAQVKIETLRQSERLKTDLLSMVSHELRTPLAVIKGHVTTFLRHAKRWPSGDQLDFLKDIDQETDVLTRLVSNLLDMSSLEAGAMKLERDYYQLSEILEWAEKALNVVTRGHRLSVGIPEELPIVFVDKMRIGQVLVNLCENAAKYSSAGTGIVIEAWTSGDEVMCSVADKGVGIPPEYLDKVFERFYRVDRNRYSNSGIGLGLAICRGIIEAHGGKIRAESELGRGSKFIFSLPVNENGVSL